ncbi:MAG: DUF2520 domain-containing protein [Pseudomonadota bacterium]|jgi:predicted short-subunit dehydrogenase-like oxidoreductase (DUF2520 family)|uniref:Rossmann-like and DUF2520 domain-containing protein n=1 Tax=Sphingobium yanoikuyae TaxID=13690 RepID=UPI0013778E6B|nr:DUF2520 domain-containing protein [Sphingobium yanoikuyae]KAK0366398.1 hypothetical protein LTR94_002969 [Friedmanniomyces endolithicus]NBB39938.1 DUF2520 domain-containing protein [Sphingobium yanoikuyae]
MTEHPAYRQIGLIGTGRVARALGLALAPHSAAPILVQGRNPDHAAAAVTAIGRAQAVALSSSLSSNCDLILLAVADDALPAVIADLTAMPLSATICHVSGRSGAALLDPLRAQGATTAAVHPAMTFTGDPAAEVARMRGARFAITGADAPSIAAARKLVVLLGGVAVEVAEAHRALYHAALCHAANHLVTLIAGASDALAAAGVAEPGALLAPLVRAALDNSLCRGIHALSGPLLRGDRQTIGNHLTALRAHAPELLPAYRAMALATLDALDRDEAALRDDLGALAD